MLNQVLRLNKTINHENIYFISCIIFFSIAVLKAQDSKKDTLFFSVDKYYTISPTITPNLSNQTPLARIYLYVR